MSTIGIARLLAFILLGAALGACTATPQKLALQAASHLTEESDRYIVAGVDNQDSLLAGHAGSSPKGYDGLTLYGPTSRAAAQLRDLEHDYGLKEITAWPIGPLHMHCAVLEVAGGADRAQVLAALAQDQRVRIAQPLQTFSTQSTVYNDPYVGLQRGFQQLDVSDAHLWSRGEGVRIAIIDTGADTRHPDLSGVIEHVANFVDADAEQFRRDRHGTELAGIIAAVANNHQGIVGVAPGARLSVFKACWQLRDDADAARCNSFTLAQALTAAIEAHAQIVNLSLSGPADPLLRDLIRAGQSRGIVFVGAAPPPDVPRGMGLMSVGGMIEVANAGPQGEPGTPLHAPGREILTLLPGGGYDFASGTSLATAHVTGTVALLLSADRKLTGAALYQLLRDTSAHVEEIGGDSINACAALIALAGHGACAPASSGTRVAMH